MSISVQALGRAIKQLQYKHHRALETRLVAIGASLAQWDALRAIEQNPGASSHDLAELTFQTDQSFGALATRLAAKGLVEREPGKGRVIGYCLKTKGAELLRRGDAATEEELTRSFAPLSEEDRRRLQKLLDRLL
ncbi:MarR family winged helix-turn-helix transcriptional regulator [Methylocapsa sp. S129]|uniref:MarR family winged helix-turn-helix transcriptional regulator n=1 Tax=Methylocapsa sp. S129 TaxID=1641869 RepID=UPI00131CF58B|nr:MarR family transcriptional regulator [Methylocapsa sp. S129]